MVDFFIKKSHPLAGVTLQLTKISCQKYSRGKASSKETIYYVGPMTICLMVGTI
jgi:hypothetical protein